MEQREQWLELRKQGKASYILKYGVFAFGLPFGIAMGFYDAYKAGDFTEFMQPLLIGVLFAGPLFGFLQWNRNEKKYGNGAAGAE